MTHWKHNSQMATERPIPCWIYTAAYSMNLQLPYVSAVCTSGVPRGVIWGVQTPPRNSEDIGEVLDRVSKKNWRLDFLL